nr:putative ribonuclease H-like domain-containing protein [Tanacetum cinerariifolium]
MIILGLLGLKFLRLKDETPEVVIKFLQQIQVGLNKTVRYIRTDNDTKFINTTLTEYYERISNFHQKTVPKTPQQNDVVKRRNHTLVEAARTMLTFSKAPMFLWAESVATACYTQTRSLIHTRHNKTQYERVHNKKPGLTFFKVFGALYYHTNDSEYLGKLQPTADIGIFVGYAPRKKGLVPNPVLATPYVPPTNKDLEILFQPMFDEYLEPPRVERPVSPAPINSASTPSSSTIDQDAPSLNNLVALVDNNPFINVFAPEPSSNASSFRDVVQIVLWYLDSGCSKLMTGDRSRLMNFVKKFIEIVRFESDHFGAIMGYGDYISSGLVPNPVLATPYVPPTNKDLEILFQSMFDEYLEPPRVERPVSPALINSASTPSSTTIDQDEPSLNTMVDVNVNAPADQAPTMAPPTRTDDQILPHIRWITPVNNNNAFSSPPTPYALINFVNDLGYPKVFRNLSDFVTDDMFQPWRALTTIIKPCLTGKTLGFERPRDPVLQILWGVVNRAHIDYAERIWEEFTQSVHTFIEDKKNLSQHTHEKKKATLIVISSVRFTKMIIYYLQSKHKFHPRLDSPLHLPNKEPVLGYLKFSAKGTKREIFGMPISNKLITADIQGEQYYKEYLEKVAKHQRYLVGEKGSDPDSPAPRPAKATKKSKPSAPKVDLRPPVTKSASSEQPKPKPAPANGRKLKSVYDAPRGPLPPMVIREPDSRIFQPLLEIQGKGKEKARPNPGEQDEGQTGPNPCDAAASQPQSCPVVHAGPNLEHIDLEATDVSTQPHLEQMDEGFTATAYPNVQENLKLTVKEYVIPEEPASSRGTLSSLQHLAKDFSFGDLFFNDKLSEADNEKTTAETKVESMVYVTIKQYTSAIPPMTTPRIGELEHIMANLIQDNKHLEERLNSHGTRPYTLENLDIPQQVSKAVDEIVTDAFGWAIQAPLQNRFRDFPEADMKEILHQRMWETNSYKAHEDHMMLYEALEKSMNRDHTDDLLKDLAEARKKKKKRRDSPKTPPGSPPHQPPPPPPPAGPSGTSGSPGASRTSGSSQVPPPPLPPPSTNQEDQSHGSIAPSSSKTAASDEYTTWTTTDTRLRPFVSSIPKDLHMDDDLAPDAQVHLSDDEDIGNAYILKVNLQQDWWKPLEKDRPASALAPTYTPPPEDSLLAQTGDMEMFIDWFCKRQGITELKPQDLEGPAFELVKVFHPNVTIQSEFFFNNDLEYLRFGSKGSRPALSISKMKAACYPDVGLEQMVPDQMWIEEEFKYDIAAIAVRTHMRILSVVRIEVFSMYGYDYMKKIVLHTEDLNEHIIAEQDFKYLYPSDFEDLYLLNLQGHLNHLPPKDKKSLTTAVNLWTIHLVIRQRVEEFQLGIESYQTQLNLTKPRWDATG